MRCTDCDDYQYTLEEKDEEIKELQAALAEVKEILPWIKSYIEDIEAQL